MAKTDLMVLIECPCCGKKFVKNTSSIYKLNIKNQGIKYYCSYTCHQKVIKERKSKK